MDEGIQLLSDEPGIS